METYTFIIYFKGSNLVHYLVRSFSSERAFTYFYNQLQDDTRFALVDYVGGILTLEDPILNSSLHSNHSVYVQV